MSSLKCFLRMISTKSMSTNVASSTKLNPNQQAYQLFKHQDLKLFDYFSFGIIQINSMDCPLQNIRVIEYFSQQRQNNPTHPFPASTIAHSNSNWIDQATHADLLPHETTPSFSRYVQTLKPEKIQLSPQSFLKNEVKQQTSSSLLHEDPNQLFKYLDGENELDDQQQRNDYTFELKQLKDKLIQIQEISQQEILRLKQELSAEKQKSSLKNSQSFSSIGVNTQEDHKDEQILILKQMLKQQYLLNKELLKQSLRTKQNVYESISITKN